MLNELRSSEVASQYSVTQRDGLQRHPPLQIDNKDERPLVSKNNIDAVKDLNTLTHKYHLSFLEPGFHLLDGACLTSLPPSGKHVRVIYTPLHPTFI